MIKKKCSVEGCATDAHARGMCWKHERSELGINPLTGQPMLLAEKRPKPTKPTTVDSVVQEALAAVEHIADVSIAPVTKSRASGVIMDDMSLELDDLFRAKRQEWLEKLADATTIRNTAERFLAMCKALDGLVY